MLIFFVPESPRWLIDHGHEAKARAILVKYHAGGDEQDPLVDFEMNEIKSALAFEKQVKSNGSWKSLIVTKGNRKRMRIIVAIGFFSQWCA